MLIAAAGLAGSGKTTSLLYLSRLGVGSYEYVGAYLTAAVVGRGLEPNPDNERKVRADLRAERGMAAIAELALPELSQKAAVGNVLIDAIYNEEERNLYLSALGPDLVIIGLDAPVELRADRLAERPDRSMSADQLQTRDRYELDTLHIGDVVNEATFLIHNVGEIKDLEEQLKALADRWRIQASSPI